MRSTSDSVFYQPILRHIYSSAVLPVLQPTLSHSAFVSDSSRQNCCDSMRPADPLLKFATSCCRSVTSRANGSLCPRRLSCCRSASSAAQCLMRPCYSKRDSRTTTCPHYNFIPSAQYIHEVGFRSPNRTLASCSSTRRRKRPSRTSVAHCQSSPQISRGARHVTSLSAATRDSSDRTSFRRKLARWASTFRYWNAWRNETCTEIILFRGGIGDATQIRTGDWGLRSSIWSRITARRRLS